MKSPVSSITYALAGVFVGFSLCYVSFVAQKGATTHSVPFSTAPQSFQLLAIAEENVEAGSDSRFILPMLPPKAIGAPKPVIAKVAAFTNGVPRIAPKIGAFINTNGIPRISVEELMDPRSVKKLSKEHAK